MPLTIDYDLLLREHPPELREPVQSDEERGIHPAWWAGILGSQAADTATTIAALNRGAVESNPVVDGMSPAMLALTKMGTGVGTGLLLNQLHKKHPLAAKIAAGIATTIPS